MVPTWSFIIESQTRLCKENVKWNFEFGRKKDIKKKELKSNLDKFFSPGDSCFQSKLISELTLKLTYDL